METAGDSGGDTFFATHADTLRHRECGRLNTDSKSFSVWGQLPPHQRHGQRRADIRQHDRDLRFRYRLDLRRRYAVLGSQATPTTSTPSIRPPERWAMPCPSPARTAPFKSVKNFVATKGHDDDGGTKKYSNRGRTKPPNLSASNSPIGSQGWYSMLEYVGRG